jgi:hypothetical protein
MPSRAEREMRRARSSRKLVGRGSVNDGEHDSFGCVTGHPAFSAWHQAFELGRMPEGGGYPEGFIERAAQLMGVDDLGSIVHLCSGSVRARFTIDLRADVGATVRADVRWLPIRPSSVRFILCDPPYEQDYAEALWGLGKQYPTPAMILREAAIALAPGGRIGFLHHVVPGMPDDLRRIGTWGITTGVGYRIRAFTIAERVLEPERLL